MKNIIKKVAAVAMAFTLLGTGTTIAKTVNPKSVTTLSAYAACNHVVDSSAKSKDDWEKIDSENHTSYHVSVFKKPVKCARCRRTIWYSYKREYWYWKYTRIGSNAVVAYPHVYYTQYWTKEF
ncbi:hypothetical protein [Ruminococcus flavefaciens]|uniref:hypothetical protein n=1 Tax=Ruminococcus flavefaciens TaxID=1265 RepID=UPI00048FC603|nr:hypothetical protein [Ruminococcus flavefaciens]